MSVLDSVLDYNSLSEKELVSLLEEHFVEESLFADASITILIASLDHISDHVGFVLIDRYPNLFVFMSDKLSETCKLKAVGEFPNLIQFCKNPSYKLQLACIETRANDIVWIENPDPDIQMRAVTYDPHLLEHITNPTDEVIDMAISRNAFCIKYVYGDNLTEERMITACAANGDVIEHLDEPPEHIQVIAVMNAPSALEYITSPSEAVQLAAVRTSSSSLALIAEPCFEAIKLALADDAENMDFLDTDAFLTEEMIELFELNNNIIMYFKITPQLVELLYEKAEMKHIGKVFWNKTKSQTIKMYLKIKFSL